MGELPVHGTKCREQAVSVELNHALGNDLCRRARVATLHSGRVE